MILKLVLCFPKGVALPQQVLLEAIELARDNLTEVMSECCNITLDDFQVPTVAPHNVAPIKEENVTSFPEWGYGVVAAGIFVILNVFVLAVWWRHR